MNTSFDLPQRIFLKGSIADIPQFDFKKELHKAVCYQRAGGWPEQTSKNNFYSDNQELFIQSTLDAITGTMTIDQIAEATGFKESTIYKRVQVLVIRGLLDKKKVKLNSRMSFVYCRIE